MFVLISLSQQHCLVKKADIIIANCFPCNAAFPGEIIDADKKESLACLKACKNEFSQNEIKLSTSLGNNNKVVNEQETGRSFF